MWWTLLKLGAKDSSTRRDAALELGDSPEPRVIEALVKAAMSDPNGEVRDAAAQSLARIGHPDVPIDRASRPL